MGRIGPPWGFIAIPPAGGLARFLHSAHWRDGPAHGWALAALQAIPSGDDGVPDADTRAALLRTLTSLPDVAAGKGLQLGLLAG